ncbi:MAG: hypothetical protein G01um101448_455 [Parcubacteria group bacterium Gr01-1014_48]|nr:MAG: hypothetical protein Greene041614_277 [Parcubacteria group bacterium Greene0416_14]TSC73907.1 MAG: hypothetical protein G01um101448_455 [Parcubacteria group bacterium Gr01-1014_48]TSD00308.1 MAG: hypothetical protein Greene101415_899 [Parcubacteria group bacterium Greene1014_15]TSD06987.1 MAG: hypothetical protein Greene07144_1042 [Parcubacteria group bacterium Greene0714_4]
MYMSENIIPFPSSENFGKKKKNETNEEEYATGDPILRKAGGIWKGLKKHEEATEVQGDELGKKLAEQGAQDEQEADEKEKGSQREAA